MPGLPDDWRPPARVALERAWHEHEKRELLDQLKRERGDDDMPRWFLRAEPDEDDPSWTAIWFRPIDPLDERPSIRVLRYPRSWEEQKNADAQAIADEHADD